MPGAVWFEDTQLNFAENLLRRQDESPAIISRIEGSLSHTLSWRELADQVARLAQWLRSRPSSPSRPAAAAAMRV